MSDGRVLEARGLVRRYQAEGSPIRAVDGVDLVVEAGETVSVMGPSGCGKSTLLPLPGVLGMRSAWRRLPAVSPGNVTAAARRRCARRLRRRRERPRVAARQAAGRARARLRVSG
jgi:ABC-type lipoprotein export system ATPase subunit